MERLKTTLRILFDWRQWMQGTMLATGVGLASAIGAAEVSAWLLLLPGLLIIAAARWAEDRAEAKAQEKLILRLFNPPPGHVSETTVRSETYGTGEAP